MRHRLKLNNLLAIFYSIAIFGLIALLYGIHLNHQYQNPYVYYNNTIRDSMQYVAGACALLVVGLGTAIGLRLFASPKPYGLTLVAVVVSALLAASLVIGFLVAMIYLALVWH